MKHQIIQIIIHHQCRVAGKGGCVAPTAWPQRMARFQSSTSELFASRWIWSIHQARGLSGHRFQLGPEGRPTDKSMCLRSAMCTWTSLSTSRAMCPKTEMRRAVRISPNAVRPVTCLHVDITDEVKPANS